MVSIILCIDFSAQILYIFAYSCNYVDLIVNMLNICTAANGFIFFTFLIFRLAYPGAAIAAQLSVKTGIITAFIRYTAYG